MNADNRHRTNNLTSPAANAFFLNDNRLRAEILIRSPDFNRVEFTIKPTAIAFLMFGEQAIIYINPGNADFCVLFVRPGKFRDGAARTDIAASRAIRQTISRFECNLRREQTCERCTF